MESIFEKNLKSLAKKDPNLYNFIKSYKNYTPPGTIVFSRNNMPNIVFNTDLNNKLGYSPENPYLDCAKHLDVIPDDSRGVAIFSGHGLGYSPLFVMQERPKLSKLVIFEPWVDLFIFSLHHVDLTPLFETIKTSFYIGDPDWKLFENDVGRIASIFDIHLLKYVPCFILKKELYEKIDFKIYELVNVLCANGGTISRLGYDFFINFTEGLKLINHTEPIENYKNQFLNKPAICIAAGPSLDLDIDNLKKIQDKAVIIAVDSAISALCKYGIEADFITSIDFQNENFEKFLPVIGKKNKFNLITFNKINPLIIKRINCNKISVIYIQEPSNLWFARILNANPIFSGAFSAAHLSLQFAYLIGANPIILSGQDLGYPFERYDHSKHTVFHKELTADQEYIYAPGLDNTTVKTDRVFLSIKTVFERIIADNPGREIINATAKGISISGTQRFKLCDLNEKFPVIEKNHPNKYDVINYNANKLINKIDDLLKIIDKTLLKIKDSISLSKEITEYLEILKKNQVNIAGFDDFPDFIYKKIVAFDDLNNFIDNNPNITPAIMELTFKHLAEFDVQKSENEEILKKQGFIFWFIAELKRIDSINLIKKEKIILYKDKIIEVKDFLISEKEFLKKLTKSKDNELYKKLCLLYLKNGCANFSLPLIDKLEESKFDESSVSLLKAAYSLLMFDFDTVKNLFEKDIKKHADFNEILGFVENEVEILEKMMLGKFHDGFPVVFKRWSERMRIILDIFTEVSIPPSIIELWQNDRKYIADSLENIEQPSDRIKNINNFLNQWEPLSSYLEDYNYLRILFLYKTSGVDKTVSSFDFLTEDDNNNPQLLLLIARILIEKGDFDSGIAYLQKAISLDRNAALLWDEIGDFLFLERNFETAIIAYENCLRALPENIHLFLKIGDAYSKLGFNDAAKTAYEAVLDKYPDNANALMQLQNLQDMTKI